MCGVVRVQLGGIAEVHQRAVAVFAQTPVAQIVLAGAIEAEHALGRFHLVLQRAHLGIFRRQGQRHDRQFARLLQCVVLTVGLLDQRMAALKQTPPRLLQATSADRILALAALLNCQIQRNGIVGAAVEAIFLQRLGSALTHLRQGVSPRSTGGGCHCATVSADSSPPMDTRGAVAGAALAVAATRGLVTAAGVGVGSREHAPAQSATSAHAAIRLPH